MGWFRGGGDARGSIFRDREVGAAFPDCLLVGGPYSVGGRSGACLSSRCWVCVS